MSELIRSEGTPVAATMHPPHPQVCLVRLAGELDAASTPDLSIYLREHTRTAPPIW